MLEVRRRVNVKKLTKGEWTFDCTIEASGIDSDWFLAFGYPLDEGEQEATEEGTLRRANAALSRMIADTCDVAAAEIARQIGEVKP